MAAKLKMNCFQGISDLQIPTWCKKHCLTCYLDAVTRLSDASTGFASCSETSALQLSLLLEVWVGLGS